MRGLVSAACVAVFLSLTAGSALASPRATQYDNPADDGADQGHADDADDDADDADNDDAGGDGKAGHKAGHKGGEAGAEAQDDQGAGGDDGGDQDECGQGARARSGNRSTALHGTQRGSDRRPGWRAACRRAHPSCRLGKRDDAASATLYVAGQRDLDPAG